MSLQFAQAVGSISWQQSQDNSPFLQTNQGPDSLTGNTSFSVASGYATAAITKQLTISSGTPYNLDLKTQTDLLNQTIPLNRVFGMQVVTSGSACVVGPAASGGITWFFGGSSGLIVDNGGFMVHASPTASTVSSGGSLLSLTPLSGAMTARLIIIGGI